jgi:hypothetical protein
VRTRNISIIYLLSRWYYEGESTERGRMGYGAHPKLAIKKEHATHTHTQTHTHNGKCGPESSSLPREYIYIYIGSGGLRFFSKWERATPMSPHIFHGLEVQLFSWQILRLQSSSFQLIKVWIHFTMIQRICFAARESFSWVLEILNNLLAFL